MLSMTMEKVKQATLPKEKEVREGSSLLARKQALTFEDVNIYYGTHQAVKNVSFSIPERAITALIGPSGCGKSTFLRSINRMNDTIAGARSTGVIQYDDVNLLGQEINTAALRKEIGMVFQKPNLFAKSIYQNMIHALKFHGITGKDELMYTVEECLRKAALWEEVKDRLHQSALSLSGGQQQRLCIARALALKPNILLLDEPCSALDPISNSKIEDLMIELKEEFTILIVTHNMHQASRISDQTAFFLDGILVEYSETNQLFTNPLKKETEDYITGRFG
ncbi:phosphate ABC transporter ATP-binding protein [Fictibacillus macauensis ZFHKF-1]|uniref:Phosphate ABC transporter ATP-binding protein n=2 Tax=Fictibacillus TaxID=1329200 RepID=I8AI83_9BACL|nr:phosphate ABC transporter ATP-binding protein [Fictibacillus macauensis ZFHKF-1]